MKYLVLGNAQMETITQSETGLSREHLGGVGAIMARELALAGADVTLMTTAPQGPPTHEIEEMARTSGITPLVFPGDPPQAKRGYAHIRTKNGNFRWVKGDWPRMGVLGEHIAQVKPDWTLVALHLHPKDLTILGKTPGKKAVNATSKKHALMIPHTPNQSVYTMNSGEARALMTEMDVTHENNLPWALGADTVMVTKGARGRVTHSFGRPTIWNDPVPVPKGTDFIGCGDAATAGLVFALAQGLDPQETVDRFVTDLMQRNADAYTHVKTSPAETAHN